MNYNVIKSALFGLSVADTLGVPLEFKSSAYLKSNEISALAEKLYNQFNLIKTQKL